jgi:hypothetical protein
VTPTYDCYEDDEVSSSKMPYIDDIKEENDVDTYDQYVGAHVRVPIWDEIHSGKVFRCKQDLDDTVRGEPMSTQCWTPGLMKLSFMMAAVINIPPM